jgi:hypothetical protein
VAVYLDGGCMWTVFLNIFLSCLCIAPGVLHAVLYVLRPEKKRRHARPLRIRLWMRNSPSIKKQFLKLQPSGRRSIDGSIEPYDLARQSLSARPPSLPSIEERPESEPSSVSNSSDQRREDEKRDAVSSTPSELGKDNPFNDPPSKVTRRFRIQLPSVCRRVTFPFY